MSVQKDRVVVSDMASEYGTGASDGYAKVYSSADSAKKHEKNYLLGPQRTGREEGQEGQRRPRLPRRRGRATEVN